MAKQRRAASSKPKNPQADASSGAVRQTAPPAKPTPPSGPERRSTYFDAVALYERGIEALQQAQRQALAEAPPAAAPF